MELATRIDEALREKGFGKKAGAQVLVEGGLALEDGAGVFLRIQDANDLPEFVFHNADRFEQIGVPTQDHRALAKAAVSIVDHVGGEVHIRALFLGLDDFDGGGSTGSGIGDHHSDILRKEVAEVDREARDCLESPQIKGLPGGLIRVALAGIEFGAVILDRFDAVERGEVEANRLVDIQPAPRPLPE